MNKETMEKNIQIFLNYYKAKQSELNGLENGIKNEGISRDILDSFLWFLEIPADEESRYAAYMRLWMLKEDSLKLVLEKQGLDEDQIAEVLYEAFIFVKNYHSDIFEEIIEFAQDEQLFPQFYIQILKWVQNVWEAFSDYFIAWHSHIINGVNKFLEEKFDNNSEEIFAYLQENNLGADKIDWVCVDRSYSALVQKDDESLEIATYAKAFPQEVDEIAFELDKFITKLSVLEDEVYNKKEAYISYLTAIKNAFLEENIDEVVAKWRIAEKLWMEIDTPFQIGHPMEFYEDNYRKAVAPEWDLRIVDTSLLESKVEADMRNMYEHFYDDIGRCKYEDSYKYSLDNMNRVQQYISAPVLYFGAEFTGLFSAQVVPNDEVVSQAHGKKIFAFPGFVLESQKSIPEMQLTKDIFPKEFLDRKNEIVQNLPQRYFEIYDIETIGHEFGHTLWLDLDTESLMNSWGNFKNIEEFKATAGGLVAYFVKYLGLTPPNHPLTGEEHTELQNDMLIKHILRAVGLMKYRKIIDIVPYYCESLIHLEILFASKILSFDGEKLSYDFNQENFETLAKNYIWAYKDLIYTYLEKQDAETFLFQYTLKEGKYFLPKNDDVRKFVEYYYAKYEKMGNQIAE